MTTQIGIASSEIYVPDPVIEPYDVRSFFIGASVRTVDGTLKTHRAARKQSWRVTWQGLTTADRAITITNGTMESGNPPTGWTADNGCTLSRYTSSVHGGSAALRVDFAEGSGASVLGAHQTVTGLKLYHQYYLSAWVRKISIRNVFMGLAGTNTTTVTSTSWTQVTATATPTATSHDINIYGSDASDRAGYVGVDDVTLTELANLNRLLAELNRLATLSWIPYEGTTYSVIVQEYTKRPITDTVWEVAAVLEQV